ncbi:MAG TPA: hypothetical protein PLN69_12190 [bacterium]|nr:hypothetical protein [bacterium]
MADFETGFVTQLTERSIDLMDRRSISAEQKDAFRAILDKVSVMDEKAGSKDILSSLVADEIALLSKIHGLAETAVVENLDTEGAYNLLQQPGSYADLNNDGFLRVGKALTWTFPPPNAPENVKDAWAELTAGMTEMESMLSMAPFMAIEAAANIKYDAYGTPVGITGPGEPGYRNIYSEAGFSYKGLVQQCLDNLEIGRSYMSLEQYNKKHEMLENFLALLDRHGVA